MQEPLHAGSTEWTVCGPASPGPAPFLPRTRSLKANSDKANSSHVLLPYLSPSVMWHRVQGTEDPGPSRSSLFFICDLTRASASYHTTKSRLALSISGFLPVTCEDAAGRACWVCSPSVSSLCPAAMLPETPNTCKSQGLCPFCPSLGTPFPGDFVALSPSTSADSAVTSSECPHEPASAQSLT